MPPSAADPFSLLGTRLDGKYDIHSVIAEGGFGVVYRATHRTLQKSVAIKVLKTPPSLAESHRKEFIDKFFFEARVIAHLEHPGIVRILDFGGGLLPAGGAAPWIVLEWIDGHTLDAVLEKRRNRAGCPPADALALLRPVFEALAFAHGEGVVHRDLKPANIMLSKARGHFETKLLDFGIAKAMELDETVSSGQTATATVLRAFTLAYASPEQIGGTRTGPWTDVHALALLLVEVLTDRAPFRGEDSTGITIDVLAAIRPTPAKFGLDVGPWEPIFARALALRPSERFQNAREFLHALDSTVPAAASWDAIRTVQVVGSQPPVDRVTTLQPVQQATVARPSRLPVVPLLAAIGVAALSFTALYLVASSHPPAVTVPAVNAAVARPSPPPAPTLVLPPPAPPSLPSPSLAPAVTTPAAVDAGAPLRSSPRPARPTQRAPALGRPRVHEHVPVD